MNPPKTADEWVARKLTGALSPDEEAAFQSWLNAAPANAQEYEVAETLARVPKFLRYFSPDISLQAFDGALTPPTNKPGGSGGKADSKAGGEGGASGGALLSAYVVLGAVVAYALLLW